MKEVIVTSESELLTTLPDVLAASGIPLLRLVATPAGKRRGNLLAELELDGQVHRFVAEPKLEATAAAVAQLAGGAGAAGACPLLVTVRLSDSLARRCRESGISYVDLNGHVWIRSPGVLIDRNAPDSAVRYRLVDREVEFFSPKSTRLARVLLSHSERTWRQADLVGATTLSQGLISRLLNHAVKTGWVEGRRGDWRLADANALLDAWAGADVWRRRVTVRQYSAVGTNPSALARRFYDQATGDTAFTQWFAANLRFPYTEPPLVSVYRRQLPTAEEQAALGLREVSDGGRLWVIVPRDEGVFQAVRHVGGFPLVCDAQIYLDLLPVGLRGPDQAKALRAWEGFCKP